MSDYITLDELKGMTNEALFTRWGKSTFPFDKAACHNCITEHRHQICQSHDDLGNLVHGLIGRAGSGSWTDANLLRSNIEQIYALRLYFRDLYPVNPPELDAVARVEVPDAKPVAR